MGRWSITEIFSDFQEMRTAVDRALDATEVAVSMGEEMRYDLRIILRELSCNALEHGQSPVELLLATCCDGKHLHVLVSDAGKGFDPCRAVAAVRSGDERGRGLHIVGNLAEAMAYNDAANKILVRMRIQ